MFARRGLAEPKVVRRRFIGRGLIDRDAKVAAGDTGAITTARTAPGNTQIEGRLIETDWTACLFVDTEPVPIRMAATAPTGAVESRPG